MIKINEDLVKIGQALVEAMAFAKTMREFVTPIQTEILDTFPLFSVRNGEVITSVDKMFLSKDEETCQKIYEVLHKEYVKRSWINKSDRIGTCPALVAENVVSLLETELIKASKYIHNIDVDKIYKLEHRQQLVELTLQLIASKLTAEKFAYA